MLAQLLTFNTFAHCRDGDSHTFRHEQERETPPPLYVGVLIHSKLRKELVDCLFGLGLCIAYDHVMSISPSLCDTPCHYFEAEKAVCPPKLDRLYEPS